jgi:succinate-semialdehyde dehydrogenase/glutarate-semialdehyde dehydrogenase
MAMATINPTTGETEFEVELHTPDEVETRIALAQTAHETLRTMSYAERAALMIKAADLIESEVEQTAIMLSPEEKFSSVPRACASTLKRQRNF